MAKHCVKCKGLLVQGAETCIICGKPVTLVDLPASINSPRIRFITAPGGKPDAIPKVAPIPPSRPSASIPGPYIRFVTAPGGRRIEDSSTAKSYKARWGRLNEV